MVVEGYKGGKVPAVLVLLKNQLLARGGLATEGIFRLTPDRTACAAAKEQVRTLCACVHACVRGPRLWMDQPMNSGRPCLHHNRSTRAPSTRATPRWTCT